MHKLTLIVLTYNNFEQLVRFLGHLSNTHTQLIKILIIDDGSNVREIDQIRRLSTQLSIPLIENIHNRGILYTRLKALRNVTTEWFCFADSDDLVSPTYYEKLLQVAISSNSDCVIGGVEMENENRKWMGVKTAFFQQKSFYRKDILRSFADGELGANVVWNKVYKTAVMTQPDLTKIPYINNNEDVIFNLFFFRESKKVTVSNIFGYYYLTNTGSVTNEKNKKKIFLILDSWRFMAREFQNIDRDILTNILIPQYQRVIKNISTEEIKDIKKQQKVDCDDDLNCLIDQVRGVDACWKTRFKTKCLATVLKLRKYFAYIFYRALRVGL